MSYERFKKFKPSESTYVPENPYIKKKTPSPVENEIDVDDLGDFKLSNSDKERALLSTSLLQGQNKHLYAELKETQRTIKELKEDIASLYSMLKYALKEDKMTEQEAREMYMEFKLDNRHLLNRKEKVNG